MGAVAGTFKAVGKTVKWLLILGALLIVVVVIAIVVSLGSAADESEKSAAQITAAKYAQVKAGMGEQRVRALLGEPESTDETQVEDLTVSCWYYGILATSGTFQFCFDNGKLSSKSRIGG